MPDREKLNFILGDQPQDLSKVRLAGLEKPFEELTISELVQLRPGSEVADTYEVNAVTDNVSVTNSSVLAELGRIQGQRAVQKVVDQTRLTQIRDQVLPAEQLGNVGRIGVGPSSAEPGPSEVRLGVDDVFDTDNRDPFQA